MFWSYPLCVIHPRLTLFTSRLCLDWAFGMTGYLINRLQLHNILISWNEVLGMFFRLAFLLHRCWLFCTPAVEKQNNITLKLMAGTTSKSESGSVELDDVVTQMALQMKSRDCSFDLGFKNETLTSDTLNICKILNLICMQNEPFSRKTSKATNIGNC